MKHVADLAECGRGLVELYFDPDGRESVVEHMVSEGYYVSRAETRNGTIGAGMELKLAENGTKSEHGNGIEPRIHKEVELECGTVPRVHNGLESEHGTEPRVHNGLESECGIEPRGHSGMESVYGMELGSGVGLHSLGSGDNNPRLSGAGAGRKSLMSLVTSALRLLDDND